MSKCDICGEKIGISDIRMRIKHGIVCNNCLTKYGYSYKSKEDEFYLNYFTPDRLKEVFAKDEEMMRQSANATHVIKGIGRFDDVAKKAFIMPERLNTEHPHMFEVFNYDQFIDQDLIENGDSIASGGVGRGLVGGALGWAAGKIIDKPLGNIGALIGTTTRGMTGVCDNLILRITVKDHKEPSFFVKIIRARTEKNSYEYTKALQAAHELMAEIQRVMDSVVQGQSTQKIESNGDYIEEIRKLKQLLDEQIISVEEFEQKKKQLLNL